VLILRERAALAEWKPGLACPRPRVPCEIPNHAASHLSRDLQLLEHCHPYQLNYVNTIEEDIIPLICTAFFPFAEYYHI
jgi:hypothetical protein